jgi:hypothetical protein
LIGSCGAVSSMGGWGAASLQDASQSGYSHAALLSWACVVYTVAAANEFWLVTFLGSHFGLKLSLFFALVQNSTWPLQVLFYRREVIRDAAATGLTRVVTPSMLRSYLILGAISSIVVSTRMIGLTTLPPSIYVVCANSEILFETILTRLVLKRTVTSLQIGSVLLVIAGVTVSLFNPVSGQFGHNENISRGNLILGVMLSLASRTASSINTIAAEKYVHRYVLCFFLLINL